MAKIDGRAKTPRQKRDVIERIYRAWCKAPHQRLGQPLVNATSGPGAIDLFYREDVRLANDVESLVATAARKEG